MALHTHLVAGHDIQVVTAFVKEHVLSDRGALVHHDVIILQSIILILDHHLWETNGINKWQHDGN